MAEDGTVLEGTVQTRTMKKRRKSNNYDVRNNTSGEVTEEVNFDWVVRYIEAKEWKAFSLDVSTTILQGDPIDRGVHMSMLKEFLPMRSRKQEAALWRRIKPVHGLTVVDSQDNYSKKVDKPHMGTYNNKEGEKVLKEDEQSHFRKLVENINWLAMNIWPDLCLDAMEMAHNFEKAWIKDIKKAERILEKAKKRGDEL